MNNLNGTSPSGDVDTGEGGTLNQLVLDPTEWHEFWITIEADTSGGGTHKVTIWIDGDVESPSTFHVTAGRGDRAYDTINYLALGAGNTNHNGAFDVDFFAYKAGILTPADIYTASNPTPADAAMVEDTWVNLSWVPGASSASHDVYLGEDFDQVNEGTGDTFRGNQAAAFYVAGFPGFAYPEGLVPGTTYYWRVDEVEADGMTKHKGNVWSFSIPPKTAYNPDPADNAEAVGPDDVTLSWTAGYGAKLHTVYIGDDYDEVSNAVGGIMQGTTTYNAGSLAAEKVYYWRVDEFDAVETHKGDVWTFTTPGAVSSPQPADSAIGVAMTTSLSWSPATSATSHEVYLGLDKDAVRIADTGSPEYQGSAALGSESLDPGKLAWHTTYYWRVDEVYNAGPVKGPIWSFTTADFISVDDFESYTDDDVAGEAIWQHWIDGFGVADNGAQAGNLVPPYCEQTIVHGGAQSMPLFYTNEAGVTNSEAALTLTKARDWTEEGVGELSLWFRGGSANAAEPLYVAVSNAAGAPAVAAHENPEAAQAGNWTRWVISLQAFADQGINLTNVDKITIGLGSKSGMAVVGGTGTIFVDDIVLYRPEPLDPGSEGLVAHYAMENDAGDSSGNGLHGTIVGEPTFVEGQVGMALEFDGVDDRVEFADDPAFDAMSETFTITAWIKLAAEGTTDRRPIISKELEPDPDGRGWEFKVNNGQLAMQLYSPVEGEGKLTITGTAALEAGQWYHVAGIYQADGLEQFYIDGQLDQEQELVTALQANDSPGNIGAYVWSLTGYQKYFAGVIDEVRAYSRVLSDLEIRYLAGD